MREIGSEFADCDFNKGQGLRFPFIENAAFVFSGRTAIETVIKNYKIRKAMLPSYCCDSMIEPFRNNNIEVCFYSVNYNGELSIEVEYSEDVDSVLLCNYFGFDTPMPDISKFKKNGAIIIEDITHSLFSDIQYHEESDVIVASLRKWGPVYCGGICTSKEGKFFNVPEVVPPDLFIAVKKQAMYLKQKFIRNDELIDKNDFLSLFSKSNRWLSENYSGLSIDDYSMKYFETIDAKKEREIRRKNAKVLYEGLSDNKSFRFMFDLEKMRCPLFVPIIVETGRRDEIRQRLIEASVYCPVHWPRPNGNCESNLYGSELSLVCDQRYDIDDMKRIVRVLSEL